MSQNFRSDFLWRHKWIVRTESGTKFYDNFSTNCNIVFLPTIDTVSRTQFFGDKDKNHPFQEANVRLRMSVSMLKDQLFSFVDISLRSLNPKVEIAHAFTIIWLMEYSHRVFSQLLRLRGRMRGLFLYSSLSLVLLEIAKKKMGTQPILELIHNCLSLPNSWYECTRRVQYNPIYAVRNRNSLGW